LKVGLPATRVREGPRFVFPVVEILPLRVLEPEPASVRLVRAVEAPMVPRLMAPEPLEMERA